MAVAQRNNWNVCNAEVPSTQPFCFSFGEHRYMLFLFAERSPSANSSGGNATASLERAWWWFMLVLPIWPHVGSVSARETLPDLKPQPWCSSKYYHCLILILFGVCRSHWTHLASRCLEEKETTCVYGDMGISKQYCICYSPTASFTCCNYWVGGQHHPPSSWPLSFEHHMVFKEAEEAEEESDFLSCKLVVWRWGKSRYCNYSTSGISVWLSKSWGFFSLWTWMIHSSKPLSDVLSSWCSLSLSNF